RVGGKATGVDGIERISNGYAYTSRLSSCIYQVRDCSSLRVSNVVPALTCPIRGPKVNIDQVRGVFFNDILIYVHPCNNFKYKSMGQIVQVHSVPTIVDSFYVAVILGKR